MAHTARDGLARAWSLWYQDYPVLLSPVWSQPAFPLDFDIASLDSAVATLELMRPVLPANLLGTPANIGYMSGALKHFFDGIYYPCLEATRRRPYALYVHGNLDTTGAVRAVESIATGLQWQKVRPAVSVTGPPGKQDLEACWELGALLAAEIAG